MKPTLLLALLIVGTPLAQAKKRAAVSGSWVNSRSRWEKWLTRMYPDAASSWSEKCSDSFAELLGDVKWDFVGKGDYSKDAVPTALLMRVAGIEGSEGSDLRVAALTVAKCRDSRWKEVLRLDGEKAIFANGEMPADLQVFAGDDVYLSGGGSNADRPGLIVRLVGLGEAPSIDLVYDVRARRYSGVRNK